MSQDNFIIIFFRITVYAPENIVFILEVWNIGWLRNGLIDYRGFVGLLFQNFISVFVFHNYAPFLQVFQRDPDFCCWHYYIAENLTKPKKSSDGKLNNCELSG